jgi:protein-tyrosine phosphatase
MGDRVDFHSHILPGVDDGSRSVEESLKMLCTEAQQGIGIVVATPHFYANHDTPERFLNRRAAAWEKLRVAMTEETALPKVILGAEVYFFSGISDSEALPQLTTGQKRYIMLEMPAVPWTQSMYREMENIYAKRGITPIIAHIDRYLSPLRYRQILKRLEELPVLVQANSDFFLRPMTAPLALRMLKENRIHLLGSDCHNNSTRKPELGRAIEKIEKHLGAAAIEHLHHYERSVLGE